MLNLVFWLHAVHGNLDHELICLIVYYNYYSEHLLMIVDSNFY